MIDCYTFPTPNGRRVTMMLELCELPYRRYVVDIANGQHREAWFTRINPAQAIPVIVDHDAIAGTPLTLTQSGAICLYLAEKSGHFLPGSEPQKSECLRWFMHAITDVGALASALFRAGACAEDNGATAEAFRARLRAHLELVDRRLGQREFLTDRLSIADVALYPVLLSQTVTPVLAQLTSLGNLHRWMTALAAHPAIARGL